MKMLAAIIISFSVKPAARRKVEGTRNIGNQEAALKVVTV